MSEVKSSQAEVRVLGFGLAQELSAQEIAVVSGAYLWSVCGAGPGNMDDHPPSEV